jgi:hypothetical protein
MNVTSPVFRAYQIKFRLIWTARIAPDGSYGGNALTLVPDLAVTVNSVACTVEDATSPPPTTISGHFRSPARRNGRDLRLTDRAPPSEVGAQGLRETVLSPKGNFEGPVKSDRVAGGRWRRTGLREVRPP